MKRLALLALLACLFLGCGTDPANVAGDYTVGLTKRDNGCNIDNWTVGEQTAGVTVTITQTGGTATANVTGAAGVVLSVFLGSSMFTGSVDGNDINLTREGNVPQTKDSCTFNYNGVIAATASGDSLSGRINYTAATTNSSSCAAIQGCVSYQDFAGSRPPQ